MTRRAPTFVGHVGAVSGSTISVRLSEGLASGIAIIGGRSYRSGQVGSFVRIPQGYHDLYAIVSQVGANANPNPTDVVAGSVDRWMTVQLVGEIVETSFERGIGQYPNINDEVHLVTEQDLGKIYSKTDSGHVTIGRLANAEGIAARIDINKLVSRHSAVLGSTGAGKSTAIASLLRSIAGFGGGGFSSARVLLLDIHGEYAAALSSMAKVFRVSPQTGETALVVPYWALPPAELVTFMMGRLEDRALTGVLDKIFEAKMRRAQAAPIAGVDTDSLTIDSPVPYSLSQLWIDLLEPEIKTWNEKDRLTAAITKAGDAEKLIAPIYTPPGPGGAAPFVNSVGVLGIRRSLEHMRSRLLDKRFAFLLSPGKFKPDLQGQCESDLDQLLASWLGHDKPITILDLSGIPSDVLLQMIGAILTIIYDALFWGRQLPAGGRQRPQLIVMEEAHRYLHKDMNNPARDIVHRIAKEGRKFGIGAMVVSQRPSEIDDTILSQCGTFIAMRLSNGADRGKVQATLPDSLSAITEALPILRTGEAIVTGEAAPLPIRCRIGLPPEDERPDSGDPSVSDAWRKKREPENYADMAAAWRSQNATPKKG